jgi:hypothetical protein
MGWWPVHDAYFEHPNGQLVTLDLRENPDHLRTEYAAASLVVAPDSLECTKIDFWAKMYKIE